ncbi:MAG: glycosyl transferase family 1, partial [Rhodobacteraceae bacterium]|nr:glycosyl transferase family 1 [Paracoccaceae bacterium]
MDYRLWLARMRKLAQLAWLGPEERHYSRLATASGLFDPEFYRGAHPWLHPLFRKASLRHFILWGEEMGLQPNPDFSPDTYLRLNPDVAGAGQRPFLHF